MRSCFYFYPNPLIMPLDGISSTVIPIRLPVAPRPFRSESEEISAPLVEPVSAVAEFLDELDVEGWRRMFEKWCNLSNLHIVVGTGKNNEGKEGVIYVKTIEPNGSTLLTPAKQMYADISKRREQMKAANL